jgi:hypothetical protein
VVVVVVVSALKLFKAQTQALIGSASDVIGFKAGFAGDSTGLGMGLIQGEPGLVSHLAACGICINPPLGCSPVLIHRVKRCHISSEISSQMIKSIC